MVVELEGLFQKVQGVRQHSVVTLTVSWGHIKKLQWVLGGWEKIPALWGQERGAVSRYVCYFLEHPYQIILSLTQVKNFNSEAWNGSPGVPFSCEPSDLSDNDRARERGGRRVGICEESREDFSASAGFLESAGLALDLSCKLK